MDCNDFPLKGDVTNEQIKIVQKRLFDIGKLIKNTLEDNGYTYFLMYGSLLGAVRNKGFIPWDIDFDFAIPEECYDEAVEKIASVLPETFRVLNRDTDDKYCAFWSKITDLRSELHSTEYESDNHYAYRGAHVDLYKLKRTCADTFRYETLCDNIEYFTVKHDRGLMDDESFSAKIAELSAERDKCIPAKNNKDSLRLLKFITNVSNIFPLTKVVFEGEEFCAPKNYDAVLSAIYGDNYITPLPYEKRDIRVDSIKIF